MTYIKMRVPRKPTKEADEVLSVFQRGLDWAQENINRIIYVGGAILFIVVISIGYIWVQSNKQEAASQALSSAMTVYRQVIGDKSRSGEVEPGKERLAEALRAFEQVSSEYAGTRQGYEASLFAANIHFRLGNYDDASRIVEELLANDPDFSSKLHVSYFFARILETKGDYTRALEVYSGVLDRATADLRPVVLMDLARCYELAGDIDSAVQKYRTVLNEFESTVYATKADVKLATLGISAEELL